MTFDDPNREAVGLAPIWSEGEESEESADEATSSEDTDGET